MNRRVDHSGKRYGALVAIQDIGKRDKSRLWLCRCDCGNKIAVKSADLGKSRNKTSCGCLTKTIGERTRIHGMYKHPAHGVWMSMINRCHLVTDQGYRNYGARGIRVCKKWRDSFTAFWNDMGETYRRGLTLERKNNNKGYYKRNCKWATRIEQNRNKRTTKRNNK